MRRLSIYNFTRAALRSALIVANNFWCIPTHVLWLFLLTPLRRYMPTIYYRIEGYLFSWLLSMVACWSWSGGYDIVEEGDDITRCLNKRTLVVVNHQSTADVPMLMAAFNAKQGVLNEIMWIMDRIFRYTNFGIVSSYHRDFFISSGKARRDESVRRLEEHLRQEYIPLGRKWIVLFPEGGFLTKRKPISKRFAEKNNLPDLENVTVPRMGALFVIRDTLMQEQGPGNNKQTTNGGGALCANNNNNNNHNLNHNNYEEKSPCAGRVTELVDHLNGELRSITSAKSEEPHQVQSESSSSSRPELDFILDITIGYPDGKPLNLQNILSGLREPCKTVLYYRVYSTRDIPRDDASLTKWTYDRFFEKEELLANFYKHKTFLGAPQEEKVTKGRPSDGGDRGAPYLVQQDMLRFVVLHLFFLTSTCFHYRVLSMVLENCLSFYSWMVL